MGKSVDIDDQALLGALVVFRRLDRDSRKEVQKATKATLTPLWKKQLATRAKNAQGGYPKQDAKLLGKGRVTATVGGKGSLAAWTGKTLSGGLDNWRFIEFGSLKADGLPKFQKGGRIAMPAMKSWNKTAARVWMAVLADSLRKVPGVEDE